MGNSPGGFGGSAETKPQPVTEVAVEVEDLEVSLRRGNASAPGLAQLAGGGDGMPQVAGQMHQMQPQQASAGAALVKGAQICREIVPAAQPLGARAFQLAGLIGTESEQLSLLSYFATLSEDFRRFQEQICRIEPKEIAAEAGAVGSGGNARFSTHKQANSKAHSAALFANATSHSGAAADFLNSTLSLDQESWPQFVLLSGPPGTGKTRHALAWARAMGLPLIVVDQKSEGWVGSVEAAVRGRDCIVFFDELDGFFTNCGENGSGIEASKDSAVKSLLKGATGSSSGTALGHPMSEVDARFPAQFRQFLDGTARDSHSSGARIIVAGTTNAAHKIPRDVLHRGEILEFSLPEKEAFYGIWGKYAGHLSQEDRQKLADVAEKGKLTARDAKVCSQAAEREAAIRFLNRSGHGGGYMHGSSLVSCPPPGIDLYEKCLMRRKAVI